MDFCIVDTLYLFQFVAALNIILYFCTWVTFEARVTKFAYAADFALLLQTAIQTSIGSTNWPQEATTNLFIVICFTCFFYVLSPNIWGTVFLLLGLLSIQSFWDEVRQQIESFFEHSLSIIVDHTHTKALYAGVLIFILFVVGMSFLFARNIVQIMSLAFVHSVKLVLSVKLLKIQLIDGVSVCCSTISSSQTCPFWFTKLQWLAILALFAFRPMLAQWMTNPRFSCWGKDSKMDKSEDSEAEGASNTKVAQPPDKSKHFPLEVRAEEDDPAPIPRTRQTNSTTSLYSGVPRKSLWSSLSR